MLNEIESENSLISFFDDYYVKFKIRVIIYNIFNEINHQKSKTDVKTNRI